MREKLRESRRRWLDYLEQQVRGAQEMGELRADEDAAQLAFELDAMLKMATASFVLHDDPEALERARRGVKTRLAAGCRVTRARSAKIAAVRRRAPVGRHAPEACTSGTPSATGSPTARTDASTRRVGRAERVRVPERRAA